MGQMEIELQTQGLGYLCKHSSKGFFEKKNAEKMELLIKDKLDE
jgi:hypothetical protein